MKTMATRHPDAFKVFRRIVLPVLGAAALVAAGAGVTLAAIGPTAPSPAFVYACYSNTTHVMYHSTGGKCPTGQTAIHWPAYVSAGGELVVVTAPDTSGSSEVIATCPSSNPFVISGSADLSGAPSGEYVYKQAPFLGSTNIYDGWEVDVGGTGPYTFTAIAICSR
jgi:hypothetical protein